MDVLDVMDLAVVSFELERERDDRTGAGEPALDGDGVRTALTGAAVDVREYITDGSETGHAYDAVARDVVRGAASSFLENNIGGMLLKGVCTPVASTVQRFAIRKALFL